MNYENAGDQIFGDISSPGFLGIQPLSFGWVQTPGFQPNLLSAAVDRLFEIYSPDQFQIIQWVREAMNDPNEPVLIRLGAGFIGVVAAAQGVSDTSNRLRGKPRTWIFGSLPGVPSREKLLSLIQTPPSIQILPAAKNLFATPTVKELHRGFARNRTRSTAGERDFALEA